MLDRVVPKPALALCLGLYFGHTSLCLGSCIAGRSGGHLNPVVTVGGVRSAVPLY